MEIRELECFLVLSEELHFGRAADRLYVSQSRVSQLLRSLESRVGGRLVERTSRRVRLTPLGERFLADLRPAYGALREAFERARADARGVDGVLRLGFAGTLSERLLDAVAAFRDEHPGCEVEVTELPLSDPFGAVRRAEVDAAIVLTPVREPDLAAGPVFSVEPVTLVVSARHPFAARAAVRAEDLAGCPVVGLADPAPRYWREAQSPAATPDGRPIPRGPVVATLQEGLTMAAVGRGGMLMCAATARHHRRADLAAVPVEGLPPSSLTLVWLPANRTARLDAFARVLTG
ncbi:LysR family transcriptional regulator [Actinomadura kijaniata]|uniref:DNA-binding transcriptional LysR family regulator n=1 Tax=Actinomadura namibiensis TaxID=182080 RepID=A0A7W3LWS3_ACTNM|nr:LysR family transcriptional regulator [Actinomadura namibiensis]MBA8955635.1 DNA-binding transcriptional LysR family regulator [Actinomadura namibiensis]